MTSSVLVKYQQLQVLWYRYLLDGGNGTTSTTTYWYHNTTGTCWYQYHNTGTTDTHVQTNVLSILVHIHVNNNF